MAKRAGFCFRCESYDAFVLTTWQGDAIYPWTRRLRRCGACGAQWETVEVPEPNSPLIVGLREAAARLGQREEASGQPGTVVVSIDPGESVTWTWREVRTCR